jgi:hypothetical protein
MARLSNLPNNVLPRDLPLKDRIALALIYLRENPKENPSAACRIYYIEKESSIRQAWYRKKKKTYPQHPKPRQRGGYNKILQRDQHEAMIQYAIDNATNGGKGATKPMLFSYAIWLRKSAGKESPS